MLETSAVPCLPFSWLINHLSILPFLEPDSEDDLTVWTKHIDTASDIPLQCVVKDNFDLTKFPVPASIRGVALAR